MKLSIIIPVYNEECTITRLLKKLLSIKFPIETEIIVADDGSRDETPGLINELNKDKLLKVHTSLINLGKGAAVRFGFEYVEGDYVLIQDADLELNPDDIVQMLARVIKHNDNVIYGSRFKLKARRLTSVSWVTILANKIMTSYTNLLYGSKLTDMATGYKMIKYEVMKKINLRCVGFEFDPEITSKLLRLGQKIVEVPISYHPRSTEEGKKIRFWDGFKYMYCLTKYRIVRKYSFVKKGFEEKI